MLYRFLKWRRLVGVATALLLIPIIASVFMQSSYGRRWALGRLQSWARSALGVEIAAQSFD